MLVRLISVHGAPLFMCSDNGPEFASHAILEWIAGADIATVLNDPGTPWQNGADESFNGKFLDKCLSAALGLAGMSRRTGEDSHHRWLPSRGLQSPERLRESSHFGEPCVPRACAPSNITARFVGR